MDKITHINRPTYISNERKKAIAIAIEYAKAIDIRVGGVTSANHTVTTKECVDYQLQNKSLACSVVGNWKYYTLKNGSEFRLESITITHY
jgi:hypothetical protein